MDSNLREGEITRRQLLGGLVTVGATSGAAGAGTAAYFFDTESSTGNDVTAGTLNLQFDSSSTIGLESTISPGTTIEGSVTLVNNGQINGRLDLKISISSDEAASDPADQLEIDTLTYGGDPVKPSDVDTLYELSSNDLVNLDGPRNSGKEFVIGLTYNPDNNNDYAGDSIDVTVEFYLNQNDSQ